MKYRSPLDMLDSDACPKNKNITQRWRAHLRRTALLVSLAAATQAQGGSNLAGCNELFRPFAPAQERISDPRIKTGSLYHVQLRGDPIIRKWVYSRTFKKDGIVYLEFTEGQNTHQLKKTEIHAFRRPRGRDGPIYKAIQYTINASATGHEIGKLISHPYLPLASKPTIRVVGSVGSSKELGASIAEKLEAFDHSMLKLGFIRPESTKVIISDHPILPNLIGPYSLNVPVVNIWEGKPQKIIAMNPIAWKTNSVKNDSVLYHERMHALLHRTYNSEAFINKNDAFQEAFADIAATHTEGSPHLGADIYNKGPTRNIESRIPENNEKIRLNSLLDVSETEYHNNSMFISNVLWKIRESVGPEKTSTLLKGWVDDLNRFRESFEGLQKKSGLDSSKDPAQQFIYDFEYFLAVMKRTSLETWDLRMARVIDSAASELGLNPRKIDQLANSLERSKKTYAYDGKGQLARGIETAAYGSSALAVEGYVVYNLVTSDDDKRERPRR